MKLFNIPHDKALHLAYGLIVYSFIALYSHYLAMAVVIVVAVAKEVYDHLYAGKVEGLDIGYTIAVPVVLTLIKDFI